MSFIETIAIRRDGGVNSEEQLRDLARGAADGTIPDYQLSAWLMAAYLNPLTVQETADLTRAMADSVKSRMPSVDFARAPERRNISSAAVPATSFSNSIWSASSLALRRAPTDSEMPAREGGAAGGSTSARATLCIALAPRVLDDADWLGLRGRTIRRFRRLRGCLTG